MVRGHVNTTAPDNELLQIIYIHDAPQAADLDAEVTVLSNFAAALTSGAQDINGKDGSPDAQPCNVIVVRGSHHLSTNTPTEPKHITVAVASTASWTAGFTRSAYHVYSINNQIAQGYRGWHKQSNKRNTYTTEPVATQLQEALNNDLMA